MPDDPKRLGANVKAARGDMSIERMAIDCGTSRHYLRDVEAGRTVVSLSLLAKIAKASGVTLAELVEGVDT